LIEGITYFFLKVFYIVLTSQGFKLTGFLKLVEHFSELNNLFFLYVRGVFTDKALFFYD